MRKLVSRGFFFKSKTPTPVPQAADTQPVQVPEPFPSISPYILKCRDEVYGRREPLPPKTDNKLTVFLEPEGVLFQTYIPHITEGYLTEPTQAIDFYFELQTDENLFVNIYMRPDYELVLDYLRKNTETVLYTYTDRVFMEKVIETIGKEKFDFIEFRYFQNACGLLDIPDEEIMELVKIINMMNRGMDRSVLVDCRPIGFLPQPANTLPVMEYNILKDGSDDVEERDSLKNLLSDLQVLSGVKDVRPYLKDRFDIESILKELNLDENK